jgi:hypothetical protein
MGGRLVGCMCWMGGWVRWLMGGPVLDWVGGWRVCSIDPTNLPGRKTSPRMSTPTKPIKTPPHPNISQRQALALAAADAPSTSTSSDSSSSSKNRGATVNGYVIKALFWRARALEAESFYDVALADAKVKIT